MRLVLYTEKTIAQSVSALSERIQTSRTGWDGWTEKSGAFSLSVTRPVIGRFERRTTLHGQLEKGDGHTVVRITVPEGADRRGLVLMFGAVGLIALALIGSGNVPLALLLIPVAAYLYIPMRGDRENHDQLVGEVTRTLKARTTPPKRATPDKPAASVIKTPPPATVRAAPKPAPKPTSTREKG